MSKSYQISRLDSGRQLSHYPYSDLHITIPCPIHQRCESVAEPMDSLMWISCDLEAESSIYGRVSGSIWVICLRLGKLCLHAPGNRSAAFSRSKCPHQPSNVSQHFKYRENIKIARRCECFLNWWSSIIKEQYIFSVYQMEWVSLLFVVNNFCLFVQSPVSLFVLVSLHVHFDDRQPHKGYENKDMLVLEIYLRRSMYSGKDCEQDSCCWKD